MLRERSKSGDVEFGERRDDVRITVSIVGKYSLPDRRDTRGEHRVFACRVVNLSARGVALAGPVQGSIGERVFANIEYFGKLAGAIVRPLDRGFVMNITASDEERSWLAAKIEWFERYKNFDASGRRTDERVVPKIPYSRMILPDGSAETCLVLDFSVSDAAISADTVPDVGTVVAIGSVVGRVVRHFEGGFAVQFIDRQMREDVEARVMRG